MPAPVNRAGGPALRYAQDAGAHAVADREAGGIGRRPRGRRAAGQGLIDGAAAGEQDAREASRGNGGKGA